MDQDENDEQPAKSNLLTRAEVAARLGVSTSTVRRYEGDQLHPTKGTDGVNRFDPEEVAALARALLDQKPPKARSKQARNADKARTPGDIAAEVFERLEQRQSLAEIVIGVRVAPELVRELHRQWQLGLIEGEMDPQDRPVLPAGAWRSQRERHVKQPELEALLRELSLGVNTRISIARSLGTDFETEYGDIRRLIELGGFVVQGPISVEELIHRYGDGEYRVSAYSLEPPGLVWEVITVIRRTPSPPR